jgi:uncharacterized protein YidB (DUF937 family)
MTMANTNTMLKTLLGLAAVAAWQNRDKISEYVKGATSAQGSGGAGIKEASGGLGGLIDAFKKTGLGAQADSWVAKGPNQPITPTQVGQGLDGGMLDQIAAQTGIPREELLKRLSEVLPGLVDQMTPNGSLPR